MEDSKSQLTWLFAATILSFAYCFPSTALAQTAISPNEMATATEDEGLNPNKIEEVVVTARKQREELSKVGLAITVATGEQLAERGINTVAALVKIEPSLQFAKSVDSTPIFSIRGVGYNDNSLQAPPTVSIYQDEVPYTYPVMTKGAILDVQRVEVLKGPQGTLYGQNATGGAINFIANKPTNEFATGVTATYGNFNTAQFDGYVSGPLADGLTARLSAGMDKGGAWQRSYTRDDTLGDKDFLQGRLLVDWEPTDNFNATINLNGWQDQSDLPAQQQLGLWVKSPQYVGLGAVNSPTPAQIAAMPAYTDLLKPILSQPIAPENNRAADWVIGTHPQVNQDFYQAALRMEWTPSSAFGLTALTSFQDYSQHDNADVGGTQARANTRLSSGTVESFFQEVRVHGDLGASEVTWQIGGNYIHDKSDQQVDQYITQSGSYLSGFPPSVGGNPPFHNLISYANNTTETKSVFGDVSVPLLDSLKLNAGIRYTDVESEFGGCVGSPDPQIVALVSNVFGNGTATAADQCLTVLTPKGPSGYFMTDLNEDNVPWRVGLEWQANDDTLIYTVVSQGYKAGAAPILTATTAGQLRPVTQESLLNYEAGIKSRLFDDTFSVNAGAFYYDYRDKQLMGRTIDPVFGPLQALLNIPKTHVFGAEASFVWQTVTGLRLDGAVTYLDSHVDSNLPNTDPYGNQVNFKGEHFPYTPTWSWSGGARYDWSLNSSLGAYVSARASYQSETTAAFGQAGVAASGAPSFEIESYGLLDLSVGLNPVDSDSWRVEVWARNVTDKHYWVNVLYVGDATNRLTGMPATYGLTVVYKY